MNINISDIQAILGLSKTRSRDDVIRKIVRQENGIIDDNQSFALDYYKNHIEQAIAEFEIIEGVDVSKINGLFMIDNATPLIFDLPVSKKIEREISKGAYARCQFAIMKSGGKRCAYFQWTQTDCKTISIDIDHEYIAHLSESIEKFKSDVSEELKNPGKHLNPSKMEINDDHCRKLIDEYDDLKISIDLAKEKIDIIINELASMSDGSDMIVCGRNFTKVTKQGAVSYSKIVKDHLPDINLDEYRGKTQTYWRLS